MGKPFVLLLLALQSLLAIDVGLRRMCLSPHLDSPSETKEPKNRIKGKSCKQTFPYAGTPEQHETFCRSKMPYDSEVVNRDDTSVTCKWKVLTARCDHAKKKRVYQINGKCFTVKNSCSEEGLLLAKPATVDHLRWLSIFYRHSETALRVGASRAFNLQQGLRYDDGNVFKVGGDNYKKVALMMQRLTPFDQFPGALLPSDSPQLRELCLAKTKVSGSAASPLFSLPSGSSNGEEERKKIGSGSVYNKFKLTDNGKTIGFAFVTRNDYLPQFADDELVDLDYFHNKCEKICTDCYAASFEMFEKYESEMPEGRFYAPAGRRDPNRDGACSAEFKMKNRKRFNVKPNTHKRSKAYIPKGRHWWNGDSDALNLPSASCADQARTAVQLVHSGVLTYVDVPSFDRRPIVCISGPATAIIEKEGECFPNSKMSNGKCVCKDNYEDALDNPDFSQEVLNLGFTESGQICVKPKSCHDEKKSAAHGIVFLVDGSSSIGNSDYARGVNFVESFKGTFANDVPILFWQYSGGNRNRFLKKGWTEEEYVEQMKDALRYQLNQGTLTYTNMLEAMRAAEREWGAGDKLLIVITDGDTPDQSYSTFRERESYGYDTVYITVGTGIARKITDKEGNNKRVSIYGIDSYSSLGVNLMKEVSEKICNPWPEGHLLKAVYGDDWKEAN